MRRPRQEAGTKLRVTPISPSYEQTNPAASITGPAIKAQVTAPMATLVIPPGAIARATAFAIAQPAEVDASEVVVRPTARS